MYIVRDTSKFRKSYKRVSKNVRFKLELFRFVINELQNKRKLDVKFKDHNLQGELKNARECHLSPDILLMYQYLDDELILLLVNIGSHSDLF